MPRHNKGRVSCLVKTKQAVLTVRTKRGHWLRGNIFC